MRCSLAIALVLVVLECGPRPLLAQPRPAAQQEAQPAATATFRSGAQEILLDLVIRDKRGRLVTDIKPDELEIAEDGARQRITGLRLVESARFVETNRATNEVETKPLDPMRQMRLVTLAFDSLGPESRRLARQACLDLFKQPLEQNVYYSVVWLAPRMRVVQVFTNDRTWLRHAVERVTGGQGSNFSGEGDPLRIANEQIQRTAPSAPNPAQGPPQGAALAEQAMNAVIEKMAAASEELSRQAQGTNQLRALWSVIQGLKALEGRKSVLYFSEGLQMPQQVLPTFQAMVGDANRANVAVYAIDARGLVLEAQSNLQGVPTQSRSLNTGLVNEQAIVNEDTRIDALRRNVQQNLQELAAATGGFLISDTNDLRTPIRRVSEEALSYYEASYAPSNTDWDGRFRQLTVKIRRPNVVVQSRSGYFALPPDVPGVQFPHEVPLLRALASAPLPRQIDYRAAGYRFQKQPDGEMQCAFHIEIPIRNLAVKKDDPRKEYSVHVSFLVLVKDAAGRVARKVTRDVPFNGPLDQLEGFLAGNFTYNEYFPLAPGRYVMESAILDRVAEKASARRAVLTVPAGREGGIALSSLVPVRRIDTTAPPANEDAKARSVRENDPFRFDGGKTLPQIAPAIPGGKGAQFALYFVVYPDANIAEKPELTIEFYSDLGDLIARARPELPPATAGRIPYLASSNIESLKPGPYEVRVLAKQGGGPVAEERVSFVVE